MELKLNPKERRFGRNPSVRLIGVLRCVSHDLPLENLSSQLSTSRKCLAWVQDTGSIYYEEAVEAHIVYPPWQAVAEIDGVEYVLLGGEDERTGGEGTGGERGCR